MSNLESVLIWCQICAEAKNRKAEQAAEEAAANHVEEQDAIKSRNDAGKDDGSISYLLVTFRSHGRFFFFLPYFVDFKHLIN